jgi:hypothetical protein
MANPPHPTTPQNVSRKWQSLKNPFVWLHYFCMTVLVAHLWHIFGVGGTFWVAGDICWDHCLRSEECLRFVVPNKEIWIDQVQNFLGFADYARVVGGRSSGGGNSSGSKSSSGGGSIKSSSDATGAGPEQVESLLDANEYSRKKSKSSAESQSDSKKESVDGSDGQQANPRPKGIRAWLPFGGNSLDLIMATSRQIISLCGAAEEWITRRVFFGGAKLTNDKTNNNANSSTGNTEFRRLSSADSGPGSENDSGTRSASDNDSSEKSMRREAANTNGGSSEDSNDTHSNAKEDGEDANGNGDNGGSAEAENAKKPKAEFVVSNQLRDDIDYSDPKWGAFNSHISPNHGYLQYLKNGRIGPNGELLPDPALMPKPVPCGGYNSETGRISSCYDNGDIQWREFRKNMFLLLMVFLGFSVFVRGGLFVLRKCVWPRWMARANSGYGKLNQMANANQNDSGSDMKGSDMRTEMTNYDKNNLNQRIGKSQMAAEMTDLITLNDSKVTITAASTVSNHNLVVANSLNQLSVQTNSNFSTTDCQVEVHLASRRFQSVMNLYLLVCFAFACVLHGTGVIFILLFLFAAHNIAHGNKIIERIPVLGSRFFRLRHRRRLTWLLILFAMVLREQDRMGEFIVRDYWKLQAWVDSFRNGGANGSGTNANTNADANADTNASAFLHYPAVACAFILYCVRFILELCFLLIIPTAGKFMSSWGGLGAIVPPLGAVISFRGLKIDWLDLSRFWLLRFTSYCLDLHSLQEKSRRLLESRSGADGGAGKKAGRGLVDRGAANFEAVMHPWAESVLQFPKRESSKSTSANSNMRSGSPSSSREARRPNPFEPRSRAQKTPQSGNPNSADSKMSARNDRNQESDDHLSESQLLQRQLLIDKLASSELYTFKNLVVYTFFAPLYLAGPLVSYDDFVAQMWTKANPAANVDGETYNNAGEYGGANASSTSIGIPASPGSSSESSLAPALNRNRPLEIPESESESPSACPITGFAPLCNCMKSYLSNSRLDSTARIIIYGLRLLLLLMFMEYMNTRFSPVFAMLRSDGYNKFGQKILERWRSGHPNADGSRPLSGSSFDASDRYVEMWALAYLVETLTFSMIGLLFTMMVKFMIIWRFGKFCAGLMGILVDENLKQCIVSSTTMRGFWQGWHCTLNSWVVR